MPRLTRKTELVDLSGLVEGQTALAYRFYDGVRAVWLPKSQCEWDPHTRTMTMPEWLAIKKELV